MCRLIIALSFIVAMAMAQRHPNVCTGLDDGSIPTSGCKAYTLCKDGKPIEIDCLGLVYNEEKKGCDDPANTPPPCGSYFDCSKMDDGTYPDLEDKCQSYYTCKDGEFKGHNPCSGGLVYSEELEVCDFIWDVPPPCGTRPY